MITTYIDNHKTYRLVDPNTNLVSFSKMSWLMKKLDLSKLVQDSQLSYNNLLWLKDSGVKLQVASLERGEDFEHGESSTMVIFDIDSPHIDSDDTCTSSPNRGDNIDLDEEDLEKRPRWWLNAIRDV